MYPPDRASSSLNLQRPKLTCRPLPRFDKADLVAVRRAFHRAADPCPLFSAWEPQLSAGFAPARTRVGWQADRILVLAELADRDICSAATDSNQRMWELGDVFEMFLRPEGQEAYVEFQVSPGNHRLQLRYNNRAALDRARETGSLAEALIPGQAFRSRTWVSEGDGRWHVLAEIPVRTVCGPGSLPPGGRWRFSFSRYDYTRGCLQPVLSSTSPHPEPDFHRQEEWGELCFETNGSVD